MEENKNEDLLQDDILTRNVKATTGQRFGNYIIDVICFYALAIAFGVIWAIVDPKTIESYSNDDTPGFNILDRLLSLLVYGLIMGVIEGFMKGKTIGKLITGTRAVNLDGSPISFQTAMLRGLCRAVPFNQLSALGSPSNPWHDRWTKTEVIDEKESGFKK
jgi:uncharacterized RDD family membrane protein YckC